MFYYFILFKDNRGEVKMSEEKAEKRNFKHDKKGKFKVYKITFATPLQNPCFQYCCVLYISKPKNY